MNRDEVLIWVIPSMLTRIKFYERIVKGVGVHVIAISVKQTIFPTTVIPDGGVDADTSSWLPVEYACGNPQ